MPDSPPDRPFPWMRLLLRLLLLWLIFMAVAWAASEIGLRMHGHTRL